MPDEKLLRILKHSVATWNEWRGENADVLIDFRLADLCRTNLQGANLGKVYLKRANLADANLSEAQLTSAYLSKANLGKANLYKADLSRADLRGADLRKADLAEARLHKANLSGADLRKANLYAADLREANLNGAQLGQSYLSQANLEKARLKGANLSLANLYLANLAEVDMTNSDLTGASLVQTNFEKAKLSGCSVYGVSAWNIELEGADQSDLTITLSNEPSITVDNLEVAQFIYLILNNKKIRNVLDTITSKVVLILGRFTTDRRAILDAIRKYLRKQDYLPVLFDFEGPRGRDITETVSILAHMARFVIADITDARSIPQELMRIVPTLPSVPVQPLILASQKEYGMFEHFRRYPWVMEPLIYEDLNTLMLSFEEKIIVPVESRARLQTTYNVNEQLR
jgi:uncharacterized protein YjbI with pentapeptide repeats